MRILLAIVVFMGGALAHNSTAEAARKAKRGAKPQYYYAPRYYDRREALECERARNEDPAGHFAGYPCWAREIFGRGRSGGPAR